MKSQRTNYETALFHGPDQAGMTNEFSKILLRQKKRSNKKISISDLTPILSP
jgi:hypothetical protein